MTQPRHSSMVFHEKALQIKSKALEKAFLKKIKVDIAPSTCPYKPIFLNIIVIVVHFFYPWFCYDCSWLQFIETDKHS